MHFDRSYLGTGHATRNGWKPGPRTGSTCWHFAALIDNRGPRKSVSHAEPKTNGITIHRELAVRVLIRD